MSNSLLNSEPKSRLKPKSVCGLMHFSTIMLQLLFKQQIYGIFVDLQTLSEQILFVQINCSIDVGIKRYQQHLLNAFEYQNQCFNTIFAFLIAQNCELNALRNLWCVQQAVLSGFVMWFIHRRLCWLGRCCTKIGGIKMLYFISNGLHLEGNCSPFAL